jgi:transcriptional regulator
MQNVIENDRISLMLSRDNINAPEQVRMVLGSEIQKVVKDYLDLKDDVKVRFKLLDEELIFMVEMHAERIKNFGYIPRF